VVLTGHFDVVDVDVCGPLRPWAFDPTEYTRRVGGLNLAPEVRADLDSGRYVFGRGVSDMKTGVALAMCMLEDYSLVEGALDFNVLLLLVPDEEGDSVGMRGSVSFLAELREKEGLDFLACVNVEPVFEAASPAIYYGTIGKIMPFYFCVGRESHVGDYYEGLNSTLVASYLNISLEGVRDTSETFGGDTFPPQCCLRMRDTRSRYAVTLPERTVLYYNCLTVSKTPAVVMEDMKKKAMSALKAALSHVGREDWEPRVLTVEEIFTKAKASETAGGEGEEKLFSELPDPQMDERERNIEFLSRALDAAGEKGPLVVVGFTPPFYPPRVNLGKGRRERNVRLAGSALGEDLRRRGFGFRELEIFEGITDLSFTGFQGDASELNLLAANVPLWGRGYSLPLEALRKIDIPCVVLGPIGKDAHKITERVELDYSFNVLPFALKKFLASVAGG
jgi:arginine utilization protein RocB